MGDDLHEAIAQRFVESGALNFDAAGKFLAEIGPELVVRDTGLHGFAFGRFNAIACYMRAEDFRHVFRDLGGLRSLSDAIDDTSE